MKTLAAILVAFQLAGCATFAGLEADTTTAVNAVRAKVALARNDIVTAWNAIRGQCAYLQSAAVKFEITPGLKISDPAAIAAAKQKVLGVYQVCSSPAPPANIRVVSAQVSSAVVSVKAAVAANPQ